MKQEHRVLQTAFTQSTVDWDCSGEPVCECRRRGSNNTVDRCVCVGGYIAGMLKNHKCFCIFRAKTLQSITKMFTFFNVFGSH